MPTMPKERKRDRRKVAERLKIVSLLHDLAEALDRQDDNAVALISEDLAQRARRNAEQ